MSADAPGRAAGQAPEELRPILDAAGEQTERLLVETELRLAQIAAPTELPGGASELATRAGATLAAGGKRLRPLLVFLCGAGAGAADSPPEGGPLVAAACSVELIHMAALLHDDVLDHAPLRRGLPTVFATDGRDAAVSTGDHLFARAFGELAATGHGAAVLALSNASSALVRGELMQRADAWSAEVSVTRYLERCELKTASLFETACRLGALLGAPGPDAADRLGSFGRQIGLAFQILDDVLDLAGSPGQTGKRRGTDLLDGTVTLPLIYARGESPELAALDLRSVTSAEQAEHVCVAVAETDAFERATALALELVADAKQGAASTDLDRIEVLDLVADSVVARVS